MSIFNKFETNPNCYQQIVNYLPYPVLTTDNNGIVLYINPAFEHFFGYQLSEIPTLESWLNISYMIQEESDEYDEDIFTLHERLLAELFGSGKEFIEKECSMTTKDGAIKYVLIKLVFQNNQLFAYFTDISEQKKKELEIVKLKAIIELTDDSIVVTDIDGKIEFVNSKFCDITGYSYQEAIGKNPGILRTEHHPDSYYKTMWNTLNLGQKWDGEFLNRKKSGELYWEHARIKPIFDKKEKIINFVATKTDITAQKRLLEDLQNSKERYLNLFKNASDAIFIADAESGLIVDANQQASNLIGVPIKEIIGMHQSMLHPVEMKEKVIKEFSTFSERRKILIETKVKHADGREIPVEINDSGVFIQDNKKFVIGSFRDVTDRKIAEMKIVKQTDELHNLIAVKDKFLSIIAHDLRNPFTVLLGMSEMLLMNVRQLELDKIEELIKKINLAAKQNYRLMENLLSWALIQKGNIVFNPVPVELNELFNENIRFHKEKSNLKDIEILNILNGKMQIMADEDMLQMIIRNLVANSLKYTDFGGKIILNAKIIDGNVEISVTDNGVGISKEISATLFTSDQNKTTTGTNREKGSGLGLILCKEFVNMHNGSIKVESEVGKGSSFKILLPVIKVV